MEKKKILYYIIGFTIFLSSGYGLDCPADSAFYIDQNTESATYGQLVSTGLCACLAFDDQISIADSKLTFNILMRDNEPVRAFQFEIIDDTQNALSLDPALGASVVPGDKISGWTVAFTETFEGNGLVFGFSLSGDATDPGTEGSLISVTFAVTSELAEQVAIYLGGAGGVRVSDEDAQNIACTYPDEENPVIFNTELAVSEDGRELPKEFSLSQNYPNPFNPTTTITYALPEDTQVKLTIYDLMGRDIVSLVDGFTSAGYHSILWDGMDKNGRLMSNGVYFYRLETTKFTQTRKMALLK